MSRRILLFASFALLVALLPAQEKAPPKSDLVQTQVGTLPIILSAPHGGTKDVPDVPARKGLGLEKGGKGFYAGRDVGTEELTNAVAQAIEKAMSAKPYFVVARFHRKYIDANRPPDIAYEDPRAKPTYDAYRDTLAGYCREVKKTHGRGLLLDLHGQGSQPDTIIRGSNNGKTVQLLVQRYGVTAHTGPRSLFGFLAADGAKVNPADGNGKEVPGLSGGDIVRTYGSEAYGLDAYQLEFGGEYRDKDKQKDTAEKVASAVAKYAKLYLMEK